MRIEFKNPKEMVNWLMDNEGLELFDNYGRRWTYIKSQFFFKDIGTFDSFDEGLSCLHLFGTYIMHTVD